VALQQKIQRSCHAQPRKNDEESQMHLGPDSYGEQLPRFRLETKIVFHCIGRRSPMQKLVTTMLTMATGTRNFHPKPMSWS
jgi:hypothetical protein